MKAYPNIKILDAKYANWNRDDAFKVMQDYLTRFKHIDAVWAADDDMAVGVLKAIDQAKRSDIKIVFGGAAIRGCAPSSAWSNVVPLRWKPTTKIGGTPRAEPAAASSAAAVGISAIINSRSRC